MPTPADTADVVIPAAGQAQLTVVQLGAPEPDALCLMLTFS